MTTIEPQRPTRDEVQVLVKECGLDWQRGFVPLFEGDETNRYEVLVRAAIEQYAAAAVLAERGRWEQVGYVMRTGHGAQFAAALAPQHQSLVWNGRPMWSPVFVRADPKEQT